MRWVKVKFPDFYRIYSYKYDLNKAVKVGDYLIVNAPRTGLTIVKCRNVYKSNPPDVATKYVLDVVNEKKLRQC